MKEPIWLRADAVLAMHERLLAEHGGGEGTRDESLFLSAMAKPKNLFAYGKPSLFDLAASYAFGVVKNHPFVDGNKRTGFMCAFVFLDLNKIDFNASEEDVVTKTLALAAGELGESDYSSWLKESSIQQKTR